MAKVIGLKTKPKKWTLREFSERYNKILIFRGTGGLGDIFMHRMMFEDFHLLSPGIHITFACPEMYHDAVRDHPFINELVDDKKVDRNDYIAVYDTTTACGKYEMAKAPYGDKNRSDIWADHCGIELTRHNMHIHLSEEEKKSGDDSIKALKPTKPTVAFAPISAISSKNLDIKQINETVKMIREMGYFVFGIHRMHIDDFDGEILTGRNLRHLMGIINAADYIISVDTAALHIAGGLNKPTVGIFAWADGKLYAKYYNKVMLVQRHREDEPGWTCGPCYMWFNCTKCPSNVMRKPCITSITPEMILDKFKILINKFPI
jgi:ADP-heptose:LPS heptosyltransferase